MQKRILTALSGLLLILACQGARAAMAGPPAESIPAVWQSVGIGGGGGIFNPSISPHDGNLVFVSCDMGGLYRSTDGARTFRMVDGYAVRKLACPIVFHPVRPHVVYAASRGGIDRSDDGGATWRHLIGRDNPDRPDSPTALAIDPIRPDVMWAHFDTYLGEPGHFLVASRDGGRSWTPLAGWPYHDKTVARIIFNPGKSGQVFVLAEGELYRSDDDGATFHMKTGHLPGAANDRDCAAAWDRGKATLSLFITRSSRTIGGRFRGGVYKSSDAGDSWQQVVRGLELRPCRGALQQYRHLAVAAANPQIVYVSSNGPGLKPPFHSTVWKSTDGGGSWQAVLFGEPDDPRHNVAPDWLTLALNWGWGGAPLGMTCNPNDPQDVIVTDMGRAFRTTDGGRRWFPVSTHRVQPTGDAWRGRGLEVSTSYSFYFDPHDANRTYIAYTDIGMARSIDGGSSWLWAGRGSPWPNTCYELALDPDRPGVLFGAWAGAHDLPHWKMLRHGRRALQRFRGGLARSNDFAATWKRLGRRSGLPDAPATAIVLDPRSPSGSRTLYAAFLDQGVYQSTDDGKTWSARNTGLAPAANMNVWRLLLHPDGTLLCAKTIAYVNGRPVPGGLFRSTDGAARWVDANPGRPLSYIFGVQMDPRDSRIIYAACFDIPPDGFPALGTLVPWPRSRGGGVFKTVDGGRTWEKVLDQPWSCDISIDAAAPDTVYAATYWGGLFRSSDAGRTWASIAGLPYVCPQRVTVDPRNPKIIYVTTFGGGVWKGRLPSPEK